MADTPLSDALNPAPLFAGHDARALAPISRATAACTCRAPCRTRWPPTSSGGWRATRRGGATSAATRARSLCPWPPSRPSPPSGARRLDAELRRLAGHSFRYLFDAFPVSDELEDGHRRGLAAEAVYDALNAPEGLDFLRALTGDPRIAYCDAQVTRFLPGHFLTQHDDDVEGKHRLYAYVLNLTPEWRPDWGGVLMFLDEDGHVAEGYTPAMNAFNIFLVPMEHCVSEVASYAPRSRLSITGWIRSSR